MSAEQQEIIRKKAVAAVFNGMKQVEAARVFGVAKQTVCGWVKKAKQKGVRALNARKRGGGPERRLKGWQAAWVVRKIRDKFPDQLKLDLGFVLWTREAVQQLILKKFGISLAIRTIGDYLARWGLTPQKPARSAYQQNPQVVNEWLKTDYPALVQRAKTEKALIFWGDEMGLRSDHWHGRTYSLKGQTPTVKTTGVRYSVNMISAISNLGKMAFSVFEGNLVVSVFLEFLERLVRFARGRKVIFIVDGHPVHRAKAVTDWLKGRESLIELVFLPGYSPELNPDEMLNQQVKATIFKRRRPRSKSDLKAMLRQHLHAIQKRPELVQSCFKAKSVLYAAA